MLGPSGSGKTTCLMMLAGFETATHGEIRLAGRPINNIPPHKRGIGMVFQNYALFPHMTVGENLAFPLQVRKLPKADDRRQGRARPRHGADGPLRRPPPGAALRRPAAAHRARPGAGLRARARADGRAARRARQAAPRAHAVRDQAPARAARRHRGLRHPRPVRGADHVRPDRRLQRRQDPAARARPRTSTSGRRTPSSPSSSARTTACSARSRRSTAASLHRAARGRRQLPTRCRSAAASPAPRTQLSIRPERVMVGDAAAGEPQLEARGARAHLHRRPHPQPAGGARRRRLHRQGAATRSTSDRCASAPTTTVGWATDDCRALDAA